MSDVVDGEIPTRPPRHARTLGPSVATRVLGGVLLAAMALGVSGLTGFLAMRYELNSRIEHVVIDPGVLGVEPTATLPDDFVDESINILILGSDSRKKGTLGEWQDRVAGSDVVMVAQLSGDRDAVNIMSIPRDSWVEIPGQGEGKINSAYSYGGPALAIETVQNLLDIRIDHFMVVDFSSFRALTDALGGVTIETVDGPKAMNGRQALEFVRERGDLPGGDFDRVRRQQAWMEAIMTAAFSQDVLSDPVRMTSMIDIVLSYSAVDSGLTFDSLFSMAVESRNLRPDGVNFFTAPADATGVLYEGGPWVATLREDDLALIAQAWRRDQLHELLEENPGLVRGLHAEPVY